MITPLAGPAVSRFDGFNQLFGRKGLLEVAILTTGQEVFTDKRESIGIPKPYVQYVLARSPGWSPKMYRRPPKPSPKDK